MEPRTRNILIIVIVAAIVLLCGGACLVAVLTGLFFTTTSTVTDVITSPPAIVATEMQRTYPVGTSPTLTIDNFAGDVTVRAGQAGQMQVGITRRAPLDRNLDQIEVDITQPDGGLMIRTRKPATFSAASVAIEVMAPTDTILNLDLGAGSARVQGLSGQVTVSNSAGDVTVTDTQGRIRVSNSAGAVTLTGVRGDIEVEGGVGGIEATETHGQVRMEASTGGIRYHGSLEGDCHFESNVGGITLWLPADLNMRVDAETSVGDIDIRYDVDGEVSDRRVEGVIGDGTGGTIVVRAGTGGVTIRSHE